MHKAYNDDELWRHYLYKTDLRFRADQGFAFSASARLEVVGNSTEYIEFRVPSGMRVRVYSRIISTEGSNFNVDLCTVSSITAGATEFNHANMLIGGSSPLAKVYAGATNPVGLEVIESSYIPASAQQSTSGALSESMAYRLIDGDTSPQSVLRIENTENSDRDLSIILLYTEEYL